MKFKYCEQCELEKWLIALIYFLTGTFFGIFLMMVV